MSMPSHYRVTVIGAASLKAKELGSALKERAFPLLWTRLLEDESEPAGSEAERTHRFTEFGDEPALLDAPSAETLAGSDVIFFAGDAAQTERHWALARQSGALLVDLAGYAGGEAGSRLFGPDPASQIQALPLAARPRIAALAHPAALLLVRLLTSLARAGRIDSAVAHVFEPVSERGLPGIQELQQQTLGLLTFKSMPTSVHGVQVAFNLLAALPPDVQPSLADNTARIASHVRQLLAQAGASVPAPALCLLQAPIFHAHVVSLFVRFQEAPTAAALAQALDAPDVQLWPASDGQPDVLGAAGEDRFQVGQPQPDASLPQGIWLHASFDNLRVAALHAVDTAAALLGPEHRQ